MAKRLKIEGIETLQLKMTALGKVPQVAVNRAAKAGMQVALKAAKRNAPVDTKALKDGIVMSKEKSKKIKAGKRVFRVWMDASKNDIFQKPMQPSWPSGKDAYYPASQEYGFKYYAADGTEKRYEENQYFLRDALNDNRSKIKDIMISVAVENVDKAFAKAYRKGKI